MAYQDIPPSASGGTASLDTAIYSFAVSNFSQLNRYLKSELESLNSDYATQVIAPNGAIGTQTQAVNGGVVSVATSAAGAGGLVIRRSVATVPTPISQNAKTDVPWFTAASFTLPTSVDANTQIVLAFESIAFSQAITLGVNGASSTTNYSLSVQGITNVNSSVAIDLSGAYVLFLLGFDGTTLSGWVSTPAAMLTTAPTLLAQTTVLTNIPVLQSCGMISIYQGSAVASKTVRADYLFEAWKGAA